MNYRTYSCHLRAIISARMTTTLLRWERGRSAIGLTKLEAPRRAQLALLNGRNAFGGKRGLDLEKVEPEEARPGPARAHPRLWAAWVLSGDPGSLFQ
jgi:hypothetical protein